MWTAPSRSARYLQAEPQGDNEFDEGTIEFDSADGFGVAVNVFWSRWISTEFAGAMLETDANATVTSGPVSTEVALGSLQMTPLTATLQFHFQPANRFDLYAGAGAAYVLFDDIENEESPGDIDLEAIEVEDEIGFLGNVGASFDVTDMIRINIDAKYMTLSPKATGRFIGGDLSEPLDLELDQIVYGAGVGFRF